MMLAVAAGENEIGSGAMKLRREQQFGVGHEHRMRRRVMRDDGATGPITPLHREPMRHSRFPIERKSRRPPPRRRVVSHFPEIALSDCGVTRTLCRLERQVYPESRLKCVALHCKAAWS